MTHYRYEIEGTGADGHRWSTGGLLDLKSDRIADAVEAAHKDAFEKLTRGNAVYGQPGKGCRGTYQISKLMIEKIAGP